jgi:hypothetical protein
VSEQTSDSKEKTMAGEREYALGRISESVAAISRQLQNLSRSDASLYFHSPENREMNLEIMRQQLARAQTLLVKYEAEARAQGATDAEVAQAKQQ